jgi:hypothetical protein
MMASLLIRYLFPGLLFLINMGAAAIAYSQGNPRKGTYWIASAVCIAAVASD